LVFRPRLLLLQLMLLLTLSPFYSYLLKSPLYSILSSCTPSSIFSAISLSKLSLAIRSYWQIFACA
jgi:hypothetical protein